MYHSLSSYYTLKWCAGTWKYGNDVSQLFDECSTQLKKSRTILFAELFHVNIMYQEAMCASGKATRTLFSSAVLLVKVSEGSRTPSQNLKRYSRRLLLTNVRKKLPVTRWILALKAKTIAAENGIVNFKTSEGWVDNFVRRTLPCVKKCNRTSKKN